MKELYELLSVREKSHLHDSPCPVNDKHLHMPDVNDK